MSFVTVVNYNERPLLQIDESMILRRMTNAENSKKIDFVWVEINGKHK
jgi:hypothetical protein